MLADCDAVADAESLASIFAPKVRDTMLIWQFPLADVAQRAGTNAVDVEYVL